MGKKTGPNEVPKEWRDSLKLHIENWISRKGHQSKSTRQISILLGVSQPTLSDITNDKGSLGLRVLVKLRKSMGLPIDTLLGLDKSDPLPVETEHPSEPPPTSPGPETLTQAQLEELRALLVIAQRTVPPVPAKQPSTVPKKAYR